MPILHSLAAPNGAACTFFVVLGLEVLRRDDPSCASVRVGGWVSEDVWLLGGDPSFNWYPRVPLNLLSLPDLLGSAETALIAAQGSPWMGGSVVVPQGDLAASKIRRMAMIKRDRDLAEFGLLVWDGSTFNADPQSQARIQGAALLAAQAVQRGEQLRREWTLADNSVRSLDAEELLALGRALGEQVDSAHATARALRAAIDTAQTVGEVDAVAWPVPAPPVLPAAVGADSGTPR